METLPIHLFKDSFSPFTSLLKENEIKFSMNEQRSGVAMAASGVIEILLSPQVCGLLATVIVAYLKMRRSRKVIITTKNKEIIHTEGLTAQELERVLENAKELAAFDTEKTKRK